VEKLDVTILYDAVEDEPLQEGEDPPVYPAVRKVLEERGHSVKTVAASSNIRKLVGEMEKDESDIVFNLCESLAGKDSYSVQVAALLELLGKPFTGTGSYGMALCQDKVLGKKLLSFHGIRYPKFSTMDAGQVEWSDQLQFPLFVKPSNTDSSVGIDAKALVHDVKELMERISFIHTQIKAPALIEEFIDGRELFVGVLGNGEEMHALPVLEWDFSKVKNGPKFATAEAKWDKSSEGFKAPEIFPEDIPEEVLRRMQSTALDACRTFKVLDYGRVDMRLRLRGNENERAERRNDPDAWEFFVIEVNPNPYLEPRDLVARAAQRQDIDYAALIATILDLARRRTRR
jgi:D-alanine-D-alanine ligase